MSIFKTVEDKIFTKRVVLSTKYTPDHLIGRDAEIRQIASLFAPALNGDEPDNAFIYGKTGYRRQILRYLRSRGVCQILVDRCACEGPDRRARKYLC